MKERTKKYSLEFQQAAVERMKTCPNVAALARDLQVRRKWLYAWRLALDPEWADRGLAIGEPETREAAEQRRQIEELQEQVRRLQRLAGQQALDLSFFKAASHAIEEGRRASKKPGVQRSTQPSEA